MRPGGTRSYDLPADRFYDRREHLWAKPDAAGDRVLVGIDALGLEALGDLAYISPRDVGTTVARGGSLGVLEAAKMTGDLTAPIGGTLVEINERVVSDPSIVNADPYGGGWIVAIRPADWDADAASLVSGDALEDWLAAEIERYREQGRI